MKIVKIYGGLGNQMFQYAFALALAATGRDEVFLDPSGLEGDNVHNGFELGRLFALALPLAGTDDVRRLSDSPTSVIGRVKRKYFHKRTHFIDRRFGYQPELFEIAGDIYYEGYWQSEKYFKPIEGEIRKRLSFAPSLEDRNEELLASMPRPIASVHVRRGDYLKYPNLDICTPGYYERAIEEMARDPGIGSLLVFSDDAEYCRTRIRVGGAPARIVDWNNGAESWQDMAMMIRCDSHIIANSSFSWWGAWLGAARGGVTIAPSIWNRRQIRDRDRYYRFSFDDIVPASWRRAAI
jgi:hypothetical protein